jgi:hydroxymethylglutaryl-CoA synthase
VKIVVGMLTQKINVGVSGCTVFLPPFRVRLQDWCEWTGNSWEKVRTNVGHSFRVAGPNDSVYTLAATAALRLIVNYDLNPEEIGFIGFGTESSTDNSAGGIIIRGMLDDALEKMGLPLISRECEVPEFKHACLGGVYALKGALRFAAIDGEKKKAIVVSSDIAEYERGSSGEQTQGAGAVALLVERNPKLFEVDIENWASASAYRGVDFRKPVRRLLSCERRSDIARLPDYPVFNGRYSTLCYTDQVIFALAHMIRKLGTNVRSLFHEVEGAFFHRPFHSLPMNVLASLYVWGLTQDDEHKEEFETLCKEANADPQRAVIEANSSPDFFKGALDGQINRDMYPESSRLVRYFKTTHKFKSVLKRKMHLGVSQMMNLGNLYTGSLPAWIAAGIEDALNQNIDLSGKRFLTIGYGSGDAAEAILIRMSDTWTDAAAKIGFENSLQGAVDLRQDEYEALHDGFFGPCPDCKQSFQFVVDSIGNHSNGFQDLGIEYYRFISAATDDDTETEQQVG